MARPGPRLAWVLCGLGGVLAGFAFVVSACGDGSSRSVDLTGIPDPFPTPLTSLDIPAEPGANYDINADALVGLCDLHAILTAFGDDNGSADLDGNGSVGAEDAAAWLSAHPQFWGLADEDGDTVATDGERIDLVQRYYGDQLIVEFVVEASEGDVDVAYKSVLARLGLQEMKASRRAEDGRLEVRVRTPDRDLYRHVERLADEPLVAAITLDSIGQTVGCIGP